MDISISQFLLFLVIFVRITSILILIPVLGSPGVPMYSRLGLALLLSVILFPVIRAQKPEIPQVLMPLTLTIGKEVLIGLI
ncbi:MAG: flagellar biosynthetic protein FliR, partial [candidate division KSB1 bacterium]|nr:flagellar biosynthetic protein FliR [candidate division KSB1 bacterium]